MSQEIRVLVWNEGVHERTHPEVAKVYPHGMHIAIAEGLRANGMSHIATATLETDAEHGLSEAVLAQTDVLIWWGHMAHDQVRDDVVERVHRRVLEGMGLVVLHSGHFSKIFRKLMGTTCDLKWREADDNERIWIVDPSHPIAAGLPEAIELAAEEMYGEHFDIPAPDELIMVSWFKGGEIFRSGCTWARGRGRVFYFRPGHETYPTYYHPQVRQVIANGARWVAPVAGPKPVYGNAQPIQR